MNHRPASHRHCTSAPRKASGAWLSLFAMLMIFIGPLISQSMPMEHHIGMPMSAGMNMPVDIAAVAAVADHHSEHVQSSDPLPADHALWAKCGYCTLLFSCPALTKTLAVVAPTAPKPADFFNALPQQGHAQRNVFPNARSRAPPFPSVA